MARKHYAHYGRPKTLRHKNAISAGLQRFWRRIRELQSNSAESADLGGRR